MRLFVALPVPDPVRDDLDGRVQPLRDAHPGLRWTDAAGWHLTLAFLGDVAALGPVVDAVGPVAAAHRPAALALGEAGRFGDRVLWVRIVDDPAGALRELGAEVTAALLDAGFEVDDRPLRAHLTLARRGRAGVDRSPVTAAQAALAGRGGVTTGAAGAAGGSAADASSRWRSDHVEVWRSHLGRGPARYEVVASLPCSG
jgi:RNA 2',3'-cyclic 3'-phosphodiesterase